MTRTIVFIPTELERRAVAPHLPEVGEGSFQVVLCGFGMAAAAARAAQVIAQVGPARAMLVGIAGAYGDQLPIGTAWQFDRVGCYGIGAGSGDSFVSAEALGWPQWPGDSPASSSPIGDVIACATAEPASSRAGLLLTVAAAAGDATDAARRRRAFPAAVAEDMEGFAVAMACRLAGVPLTIVRGISNVAGDRTTAAWKITDAAEAAGALAARLIREAV